MRCPRTHSLMLDFAVRTKACLVSVGRRKRAVVVGVARGWSGEVKPLLLRRRLRHSDVPLYVVLPQAHRGHMRRGSRLEIRLASFRPLLLLLKLLLLLLGVLLLLVLLTL